MDEKTDEPLITTRRLYDMLDEPAGEPGTERTGAGGTGGEYRVLVDRLWPRGVAKARLRYDEWDREVAPSAELRRRFHSGALGFPEFAAGYRAELEASPAPGELLGRFGRSGRAALVLLYGAKDEAHNHAQVLAEHLREQER